jgi:hypothetical protein
MSEHTQPETLQDRIEDVLGLRHDLQEVGTGAIARKNNRTFWIDGDTLEVTIDELPPQVRDQLERGRGLRYMAQEIDGVTKLTGERRAREFLLALEDQLGPQGYDLEYRPEVADVTLARDADVPVWIAAQGKYYIAAWLAAHGFTNSSIANGLDVSESTIKVNLSKFKNGDL